MITTSKDSLTKIHQSTQLAYALLTNVEDFSWWESLETLSHSWLTLACSLNAASGTQMVMSSEFVAPFLKMEASQEVLSNSIATEDNIWEAWRYQVNLVLSTVSLGKVLVSESFLLLIPTSFLQIFSQNISGLTSMILSYSHIESQKEPICASLFGTPRSTKDQWSIKKVFAISKLVVTTVSLSLSWLSQSLRKTHGSFSFVTLLVAQSIANKFALSLNLSPWIALML